MKKTLQNTLKVGAVIALMLSAGAVSAQIKTATAKDFTKADNTVLGQDGGSVRVIDNKGTIKYLQTANGLTTFTDTAPNGGIVTTWQLGGTLASDTEINAATNDFKITLEPGATPTGKAGRFILDGIQQAANGPAATVDAATGYTLLVRDADGQVKRILATDLVSGIRTETTQGSNATADVEILVDGLPLLTEGTTMAKLFVFRNGAKLRPTADFTTEAGKVTIKYSATDLPMYAGDVIEIQYIK